MSYPIFSPGDLVLLEHIPHDNPLDRKIRPALVLSKSNFNQSSLDVIVATITSQIRHGDPYQIILDANAPHFKKTGLKCTSAIKCSQIFSFPKTCIKRKLGHLDNDILSQITNIIISIFS